jgi:NADH-quinone oxidoreductase subunit J
MTWDLSTVTFVLLSTIMLAGGVGVVFVRGPLRLGLSLGAFLIAVAGIYLYFAMPFLAVAQLFVYVGGVLVLVLFAVMLLRRSETGEPVLESRHDVGSMFVAGGVFTLVVLAFWRTAPSLADTAAPGGLEAVGDVLLDTMLPHFEAAGVLLLAALIAVLAVTGGDRR